MTFDPAVALRPAPAWLSLNPDLDVEAAARTFAEKGRLHLPGVLVPEAA